MDISQWGILLRRLCVHAEPLFLKDALMTRIFKFKVRILICKDRNSTISLSQIKSISGVGRILVRSPR